MNLLKKVNKLIFKPRKYLTFKYPSNVKYKIVKETKENYYIPKANTIFPQLQRVSKTVENIKFVKYEYKNNE